MCAALSESGRVFSLLKIIGFYFGVSIRSLCSFKCNLFNLIIVIELFSQIAPHIFRKASDNVASSCRSSFFQAPREKAPGEK